MESELQFLTQMGFNTLSYLPNPGSQFEYDSLRIGKSLFWSFKTSVLNRTDPPNQNEC